MAKDSTKQQDAASSWSTFKVPPGGSSSDIRKSAAAIQTQVAKEKKVFGDASLLNGGTRSKD